MTPLLLLVPGMLNDERVWDDVLAGLPAMAAETRIVPVTGADSMPGLAAAAWAQVADLAPDRPLVLAGFSLGGYVVLEMLARPHRPVAAAALVSTQARPETAEAAARRLQTIARMAADFEALVDGIVRFGTQGADAELQQRLRRMMLAVGPVAAERQMRAIMARQDHRERLAALDLPVQVLCGREDRIVPCAAAEELAALIPGAGLDIVDGAGHMLPLERPAAVLAALKALLERTHDHPRRHAPCAGAPS